MAIRKAIEPLLVPLALGFVWELVGRFPEGISSALLLLGVASDSVPDLSFIVPITGIAHRLLGLVSSGEVLPFLWSTLWRTVLAFCAAAATGVVLGVPLGLNARMERCFVPTIDALRSIPPIALLPLMILLFGIESRMKFVFVCFGGLWPVIVSTAAAFKSIEPVWIKVARNLGHSRISILVNVMLPAALPHIVPGLKISLSISLILSIIAEMTAGTDGLGHYLNYAKRTFDFAGMFATIALIGLLGWLLNRIAIYCDKRLLGWHYRSTQHDRAA